MQNIFAKLRLFSCFVPKAIKICLVDALKRKLKDFKVNCFLEKHTGLHQAATFCIHDYFDMLIQSIISVNDLTVFLKQYVDFD